MRSAAVLVAMLVLACSGSSSSEKKQDRSLPPEEAARVLIDRNWIDTWPTSKDEQLHVYRFTPSMGGGVYQDRTLFKGTFELFRFGTDGTTITFDLPETGDEVTTRFRIERTDGPEPFDLKLTLDESPRGPPVYYGRTAETGALWPHDLLMR